MRILLASLVVASSGCLIRDTLSGQWVGCDPGDEVYVGLSSGTEGADEADYFACERGGFEMSIPAPSFDVDFRVIFPDGGASGWTTIKLEGIVGDYDMGVVQL